MANISYTEQAAHFSTLHFYTTKIIESVCMEVCPAMRFVMLGSIELKVDMGVGDRPGAYF